ncbi:MAG: hypothetical protein Kow0059_19690 [Candidatus Sumerlaeia bacterium]
MESVAVNLAFRLEVAADTCFLEMIASLVERFCLAAGLEDDDARGMQVAVDEICTNTVMHGYGGDSSRRFVLEGYRGEGRVGFVVIEWGKPFEPDLIPEPDLEAPLEDRPIGGLGLYLVRRLTDHFEYSQQADGCKSFRLEKTVGGCGPTASA